MKNKNDFAYVLIYLLGPITGLLFFFIGKGKRQKQHAIQAIILGIIAIAIGLLPFIGPVAWLIWIYGIYIGYRASVNQEADIPFVSSLAKSYA